MNGSTRVGDKRSRNKDQSCRSVPFQNLTVTQSGLDSNISIVSSAALCDESCLTQGGSGDAGVLGSLVTGEPLHPSWPNFSRSNQAQFYGFSHRMGHLLAAFDLAFFTALTVFVILLHTTDNFGLLFQTFFCC